jgi:hypothetical protein
MVIFGRTERLLLVVGLILLMSVPSLKAATPTGVVKGKIVDAATKAPLLGVTVIIQGTKIGTSTDEVGVFRISGIPVGHYSITMRSVGYEPITRTDVIIKPGRTVFVDGELKQTLIEVASITVTAGYFAKPEDQPTSMTSFSSEEIRRSPGTAGDVSRIVSGLPSVAKVNDQVNSLAVRGGSPFENAFYLDNIEIPNINHFPLQGTTGGPIGLLNVDFIKSVDFSAGGFSAAYGNRLSSVMEISFREGNREELEGQVGIHMAGAEGIIEGPLAKGRGSWMFSARRSFLELLVDAIGTGVVPIYSDYQGKVVYDLSPRSQLSLLGVYGTDLIKWDREQSRREGNTLYGASEGWEAAYGINWRYRWDGGYSNTSLGYLATKYGAEYHWTRTGREFVWQNSTEASLQFRNVNHYRLSENRSLEFGFETKHYLNDWDYRRAWNINNLDVYTPADSIDVEETNTTAGVFFSMNVRPAQRLSTTIGLRFDWTGVSDNYYLSPRFSFSYEFTDRTALTGATGVYYQFLNPSVVAQDESFRDLRDPMAVHLVLGLQHLLAADTRLTVETYFKQYYHFPADTSRPQFSIADEYGYGFYTETFGDLQDVGKAFATGLEVTLQKKLVSGLYGLVSGAYFRSRYEGFDGLWRDRIVDNRVLFSVEGGYKPNHKWEYSLRWVFAGGRPYTPLDTLASRIRNYSTRDADRVNEERFSDYHSLNLRVDRRFDFSGSNMVVYISVWNAYDRKNEANIYWNKNDRKEDVTYQWSRLPVLGVGYEF